GPCSRSKRGSWRSIARSVAIGVKGGKRTGRGADRHDRVDAGGRSGCRGVGIVKAGQPVGQNLGGGARGRFGGCLGIGGGFGLEGSLRRCLSLGGGGTGGEILLGCQG